MNLGKKRNGKLFRPNNGADRAVISEFFGIYMLATIVKKSECGLYKDYGLLILHHPNEQQIDRARKTSSKYLNMLDLA